MTRQAQRKVSMVLTMATVRQQVLSTIAVNTITVLESTREWSYPGVS